MLLEERGAGFARAPTAPAIPQRTATNIDDRKVRKRNPHFVPRHAEQQRINHCRIARAPR